MPGIFTFIKSKIDHQKFEEAFNLLLQQDTNFLLGRDQVDYFFYKGRCLHGLNQLEEALVAFNSIIHLNETRIRKSISFLQKDIAKNEEIIKNAFDFFQKGLFSESLEKYQTILNWQTHKVAALGVARSYEALKEVKLAKQHYDDYIKKWADELGYFYRCRFLIKCDDAKAKKELTQALRYFPESDLLIGLTQIHFPTGYIQFGLFRKTMTDVKDKNLHLEALDLAEPSNFLKCK